MMKSRENKKLNTRALCIALKVSAVLLGVGIVGLEEIAARMVDRRFRVAS
jgi:hypothetical protein